MKPLLLSARDLTKHYGDHLAVDGLNLSISAGEIYGLVGPDGTGKTTTLRLLCGALKRDRGEVSVGGFSLERQPEQARAQIGYLSQYFSLYEDLSVLENIRFLAEVRGLPAKDWQERVNQILAFVGLDAFKDRLAGQLSGGMKQKLSLAAALVNRPRLLLLDEPTTGVDPLTRQDFWQLIIRLAAGEDMAVLICTPYMDEATRCTRVGFMRAGRLIAEDTPFALRRRLAGQILELTGGPIPLLLQAARADPGLEDAQRFGERLHLRVRPEQSAAVQARLTQTIHARGGHVESLVEIQPMLEDVFIAMAGPQTGEVHHAN